MVLPHRPTTVDPGNKRKALIELQQLSTYKHEEKSLDQQLTPKTSVKTKNLASTFKLTQGNDKAMLNNRHTL